MKKITLAIFSAITLTASAQTDSISPKVSFSGGADVYYSFDLTQPENHIKPGLAYNHSRHNEFNLNLGYIKGAYTSENVRANIGLMAGTYSGSVGQYIYEANVGVKISKKKNLWVDAGIMPSHIGYENIYNPSTCWNLTRSLAAENTPYFQSGAKITYISDNKQWLLSGLVLNGWQRIYRINGNNTAALGTQITFTPNETVSINSSSFVGNEMPDSAVQVRYYHNLYGIFKISAKVSAIAGFDFGAQQNALDSSDYDTWFSPYLTVKAAINDKFTIAARGEYFSDQYEVLNVTGTENGYKIIGYSLNLDYAINEHAMWRAELRSLSSVDKIYVQNNELTNQNYFMTTSLVIKF